MNWKPYPYNCPNCGSTMFACSKFATKDDTYYDFAVDDGDKVECCYCSFESKISIDDYGVVRIEEGNLNEL